MKWIQRKHLPATGVVALTLAILAGCKASPQPDYGRQLAPGAPALRKVDPRYWPSFATAFGAAGRGLSEALDRGLEWFAKPSTQQFFPVENISHEQVWLSVFALGRLIDESDSAEAFESALRRHFDLYMSVGWDDHGTVLFTGYYSPVFSASRTRQGQYRHPLYTRPSDLSTDPITGEVLGRRVGATTIRYPARAQIEAEPEKLGLTGRELVFLRDKFDAYIIHVNGSARLTLTDGSTMHIGYAGSNGREYTSIGRLLIHDTTISEDSMSLATLRNYFASHPDHIDRYTLRNERFVFFQEYAGESWPSGSLGFKVTPWRTVATDKRLFPRGSPVLVDTMVPKMGRDRSAVNFAPFSQLMVDQDTGGAIRAAGRADLYMGVGAEAETRAGRQAAEGRLYYLILRTDQLDQWREALEQSWPVQTITREPSPRVGAGLARVIHE